MTDVAPAENPRPMAFSSARPVRGRAGRLVTRPFVAALCALLAAGLLVAGGLLLAPVPVSVMASASQEPIGSTELVCPVTTATVDRTSRVVAGVAPVASVTGGIATLADLVRGALPTRPVSIAAAGDTASRVVLAKSGPPVFARATGSFAIGLGADQVTLSRRGSSRGLAAAPCGRPITDGWLVGAGSTLGRVTTVMLVNVDDQPAQVDLRVYGLAGEVVAPGGSGILVRGSSRSLVRLDALAPDQVITAIHVIARSGRVAITALDSTTLGLVPRGMSLLPTTSLGTSLVIPLIPEGVDYARLDLLSPDLDTTVSVQLLTPDGLITPSGLDQIDLQAGHVKMVQLGALLEGQATGVLITSTEKVVAGAEIRFGTPATALEHDSTAPVPALTGPGIVVGLAAGTIAHTVGLSAPAAAATVRLDLYVGGSTECTWSRTVTVPAGSVLPVAIPVRSSSPTSILVVTPVSGGPVYAARELLEPNLRGPLVALAPIYPIRTTTLVPAVVSLPGSSVR